MHDVARGIESDRRLGDGIDQRVPNLRLAIAVMAAAPAAFVRHAVAIRVVGTADRQGHGNGGDQRKPGKGRQGIEACEACRGR